MKTTYVAYENTLIRFDTVDGVMKWNGLDWVNLIGLTGWVVEGNRITKKEADGIIEGMLFIDNNDMVIPSSVD